MAVVLSILRWCRGGDVRGVATYRMPSRQLRQNRRPTTSGGYAQATLRASVATMFELDALISLDEAATILGRSPATLRWAAGTGRLQARRVGRDWVTTHDAVTQYAVWHARGDVFVPRSISRPTAVRERL